MDDELKFPDLGTWTATTEAYTKLTEDLGLVLKQRIPEASPPPRPEPSLQDIIQREAKRIKNL